MEKIFSKKNPDQLLHIIVRDEDFKPGRTNIVPDEHFIQCALLNLDAGTTFKPHKHLWKENKSSVIAQESWIVIKGRVKAILYDVDDTIICEPILNAGDASFTLFGGHNYEILDDNSKILEYKTGPYQGQELDKEFINQTN
jgi:hypothetical protein